MTDSAKLPKIVILGTGGTIVSSGDDPLMLTGYRIKGLNVETLLCAVPELQYFARIEAHQIANIDSSSMTFSIWLELGRAIEKAAADPETAGIVAPALVLYELGGMGNRPSPTYEGNRG